MPPAIHIAGTNGKGSTLAFLKSIFEAAGLRVHRYISPHLVEFNERIELAGEPIADEFLNEILHECKVVCEQQPTIPITFFEGTTLAAFLAFSRIEADILLLETGLGGEFDATNILPSTVCSIITAISIDHQEFLGETLAKIAKAKAGIIKQNCPVILAKQDKEAVAVISDKARQEKAQIIFNDEETLQNLSLSNFGEKLNLANLELGLIGEHQQENAKLAIIAALTQKAFKLKKEHIYQGLKHAFWPARLQKIQSGYLYSLLKPNSALYLDGSHNLEGAKTLSNFLKNCRQTNKIKVRLIVSMLEDKDCQGFLGEIAGEIDELIAIPIHNQARARKVSKIIEIAKHLKIRARSAKNFESAFKMIGESQENQLVVVSGSLYLAGEFLTQNL